MDQPHNHEHCHHHGDLSGACHPETGRPDYFYFAAFAAVALAYSLYLGGVFQENAKVAHFTHQVFELMNDMWWGIAISIVVVGFLNLVPRELIMTYFSSRTRTTSLLKATLAGTLFDLCNHGVLILGMKIYDRGASLGQTMAFLISSPWNSFSLTVIMYALIGGNLTFLFLVLSLIIAFITGWIFDELVKRKILPENPNKFEPARLHNARIPFEFSWAFLKTILVGGFKDSRMILKWIFVGVLLSALVGVFMTPEDFAEYFGNSLKGTLYTLFGATALEVCSEGSIPLAADLVKVAHAPGNAFIFLMAGVATDFTEIFTIREKMKSWKIALLLPLITVPQIILFGLLMNWGIL